MRRSALVAAFLWLLAGCNPQAPKAAPSPTAAAKARPTATPLVLVVKGKGTAQRPVHVIQQVHNRVDYDLLASSYESRGPQNAMRSVFTDARVTFRDKNGSTIAANAPQAIVDQTANTVTLQGGVDARTAAGMTLHCDRLVYVRGSGTLHGDGNVVITDPKGFRATGSSFDSDITLTHMRMQ
ncbi:MAG TPA: LPS export ABC transporter periplasmic protein LptC [Candidatus Cybelea sp.]|nr:LPS export ABC transporter periplasmic protein LptC [Candidatus Cybelea sp.]